MHAVRVVSGLVCLILGLMLIGAGMILERYRLRDEACFIPGVILFLLGVALLSR